MSGPYDPNVRAVRSPWRDERYEKSGVTERELQLLPHGPVTYEIFGPVKWVDKRIEDLFHEYHPCGYGTRIASNIEADGYKRVKVERADSCD
jgi:hypothetical protein